MRTDSEMMKLILDTAAADERVRAVTLTGSRVNPDAPADCFRDFDIMYVVRDAVDVASFTRDRGWIDRFGDRIMLQMPELNRNPDGGGHFTYLMLFTDGNRVDLTLLPANLFSICAPEDSEDEILLDKDRITANYPPVNTELYNVKPPSELDFQSCCNNFWWCSQNVAKGIWRDELPYAMYMYNNVIRDEFHDMIGWYIGVKMNFTVSAGKMGKYFKRYLSARQYDMYVKTYSDGNYENMWDSLFAMCDLFRETAQAVAANHGYKYHEDYKAMTSYLRHVRALPKDAREIY